MCRSPPSRSPRPPSLAAAWLHRHYPLAAFLSPDWDGRARARDRPRRRTQRPRWRHESLQSRMVAGDVLLVQRGNCKFTKKAKVAKAAGATAIIIINNNHELCKMVCDQNETDLDINIPAVLLPKDVGSVLKRLLARDKVSVQLYSPDRPLVDTAEVFLWFMAVGTILGASYWLAWSA